MVKIDERTREAIIMQMLERAKSYTPEWNLNPKNPDIAAVLALACADMVTGTIKKINGTPLKNKIAFFNMINASLLPAAPSEGYVSFSLSADDVGSTEMEKGTVLTAYTADGDTMRFETCDDILVSPARIEKVFFADDSIDFIGEYENFKEEKTGLFGIPPVNLQSHMMRITHPYAFDIRTEGRIRLSFFQKGGMPAKTEFIKALADPSVTDIEYYAGEDKGFVPFSYVRESSGSLVLAKDAGTPAAAAAAEEDGCNIRFTVKKVSAFDNFSFSYAEALPNGSTIAPDCVTDGNVEYNINAFYPFGERFQLFSEVYFGCGEVLDKRGASITMSFDMSMQEVPIENQPDDLGINYKWIAKKSDFKEAQSYRISITGVIWEYFNGNGWSRLFTDETYSDMFNFEQGVMNSFKTMTFVCPEDMTETFVGAQSGYYIRARVLKAENLYKNRGWFMSPFIRNISFDYRYEETGCRILDINTTNCIADIRYDAVQAAVNDGFTPFYCAGASERTIYLGFTAPPDNGPMRILWDIAEDPLSEHPELLWRYLSGHGWKQMNIVDETDSFTKVGLTIFLDNHDFRKTKLFGEELYWVSVTDIENAYRTKKCELPIIKHIYQNTVRAVNVDSHNEEYFAMNIYTENAEFPLASAGVLDMEVYVNEFSTITEAEAEELEKEGRVSRVYDSAGIETEIWVRWNEVNSFVTEDHTSRSYVVDRSGGKLIFGNGRKGRIPSASDIGNIKAVYTTGGGERTNVDAGGITSLERSFGFVSGVTNPKRFYGGCDTETVHDAMRRNAVMLRTQGKAVTVRDLESLTFNASRNIRKIRCICGRNAFGDKERGAVTLVVLKNRYAEFSTLRKSMMDFLSDRVPGNLISSESLYITEPTFIQMNVRAEITTKDINGIFELKRSVEKYLKEYFESFSGSDGDNVWRLGMIPNEQQIRSAILRIKNVVYIKRIYITTYISGAGGLKEVDSDGLRDLYYILPENGEHEISVTLA